MTTHRTPFSRPAALRVLAGSAAAIAVAASLCACFPLAIGGVVGGAMLASDRRTSGAQIEDETIELKARNRLKDAVGDRGHISNTSYNRLLLVTGEAQSEADKAAIEQALARIENVRSIVNEVVVMGSSSLTARSNDALLTSKVKAALLDAGDVPSISIKVVTERSTVYLMGRLTEAEANRASDVARGVGGVQKVVRVFEPITEAERATLEPRAAPKP